MKPQSPQTPKARRPVAALSRGGVVGNPIFCEKELDRLSREAVLRIVGGIAERLIFHNQTQNSANTPFLVNHKTEYNKVTLTWLLGSLIFVEECRPRITLR